jgi:aryl-alcohol dehydrogenase-like predicted oxidoreductase
MHYREFGATGLMASELGFGCGRVGPRYTRRAAVITGKIDNPQKKS